MHFNKLSIHNFGIYRGRHEIDLSTRGKKSIILIGALNGSGKTTFLDALQLVLYGKSARCSGRNNLSYKDYLKSTINRYASPNEGAGIEVSFDHMHDGVIQTIKVNRTWIVNGNTVSEKIEVFKQGYFDDVLSGQWQEYVEDYIPSSISELFFFDGEKVEGLADNESSSKIIKTGIHSLLGLNIIDKLGQDLKVLQKNKISFELSKEKNADLSHLESEIVSIESKISAVTNSIATQNTVIDGLKNKINVMRNDYILSGGELVDNQLNIKNKLDTLYNERNIINKKLIEAASGFAPFILAKNLILNLVEIAGAEQLNKNDALYSHKLINYCNELLKYTSNHIDDKNAKRLILEYVNNSISKIAVDVNPSIQSLDISYEKISKYNSEYFDLHQESISNILDSLDSVESEIISLDRMLKSMPDPDSTKQLKEQLQCAEQNLAIEVAKKELYDADIKQLRNELDRQQRKYLQFQLTFAQELSESESNKRIVQSIDYVKVTLDRYREKVLEKNLDSLAAIIYKCFIKITRKSNSYSRIALSDKDYSLSLYDAEGHLVPTSQLSAGERQVLAVSILWGLTLASGKELPTIIDTPLGRLDGKVRPKLAAHYFPYVSKQTIILSTDVEINQAIYPDLKKHIAKEYLIEYSEELKSSTITNGYFIFEETSA